MTLRTLPTIAAITSLFFGGVGLLAPQMLARTFGVESDMTATATTLARLASAAYIGYAVLAWLARDVSDPAAWRAVAAANTVSWTLSAVVAVFALSSGVGSAAAWAVIALQVAFAVAWSLSFMRRPIAVAAAG